MTLQEREEKLAKILDLLQGSKLRIREEQGRGARHNADAPAPPAPG